MSRVTRPVSPLLTYSRPSVLPGLSLPLLCRPFVAGALQGQACPTLFSIGSLTGRSFRSRRVRHVAQTLTGIDSGASHRPNPPTAFCSGDPSTGRLHREGSSTSLPGSVPETFLLWTQVYHAPTASVKFPNDPRKGLMVNAVGMWSSLTLGSELSTSYPQSR